LFHTFPHIAAAVFRGTRTYADGASSVATGSEVYVANSKVSKFPAIAGINFAG
jgi:hypothetical protein